jgi:hypothetical protein
MVSSPGSLAPAPLISGLQKKQGWIRAEPEKRQTRVALGRAALGGQTLAPPPNTSCRCLRVLSDVCEALMKATAQLSSPSMGAPRRAQLPEHSQMATAAGGHGSGWPRPNLVAHTEGARLPYVWCRRAKGRQQWRMATCGCLRRRQASASDGGMLRPAVALTVATGGGHGRPDCG